ncbi:MAG: hypothetical protein U9O56_05260 [Campylobacterota bacterium]|nr:hypothetical protein [Campylobacterota bacterium]
MIAIPIKKLGENPVLSDTFGKSKFFAIVEGDLISFEANKNKDAVEVVDWLYDLGVSKTFIPKIGVKAYTHTKEMDMKCFHIDAKQKFIDIIENMKTIIKNNTVDTNSNNEFVVTTGC